MLTINNRDKIEWKKDITVQDILDKLGYNYELITITVNDKLIPEDEYNKYKVPDNASINIFHLAHGG